MSANTDELIWAAGLFEGEGSIFPERKTGRRMYVTVRMSLNTTDHDVVERFRNIMGGTVHMQKIQRPEQKQQWKWTLYGYEPARVVLALWRPWLGQRRLGQFEYTLRECELAREAVA